MLKLINDHKHAFLALVDTFGETAGIKWDDLIIKFEWTFQVTTILENPEFSKSEELQQVVQEAAEKLKFSFNEEMVAQWRLIV